MYPNNRTLMMKEHGKNGTVGDESDSKKRSLDDEHLDSHLDKDGSKKSKVNTDDEKEEETTATAGGEMAPGTSSAVQDEEEDDGDTGEDEDEAGGLTTSETTKEQGQPHKGKETGASVTPTSPTQEITAEESKAQRDERRMEINRQRAKEIRKRKKKMVEDMQKQIIYLTLENNKLRTQIQMQQAEINILRNNTPKPALGGTLGNIQVRMNAQCFDFVEV